jgi:phosphoserine aminotransferase
MNVRNFNPGPAFYSREVNLELQKLGYTDDGFQCTGIPIGSTSHRNRIFLNKVLNPLNNLVRELLEVPDNYHIIWTRDGATEQWSRIIRNFESFGLNYVDTGIFAKRALNAAEAINQRAVKMIITGNMKKSYIPIGYKMEGLTHITLNNTIEGTEFNNKHLDSYNGSTLICDATSNIFSKKIYWDKHDIGMLYASTQKNMGEPGSCLLIIKDKLLEKIPKSGLSDSENYKTLVEKDSGLYTSNVSNLLRVKIILEKYKKMGGISELEIRNKIKSDLLYNVIDKSDLYIPYADKNSRSMMNVVWKMADENATRFVNVAENHYNKFFGLMGHKDLPHSIRASIYNMMNYDDVFALSEFMQNYK